MLLGWSLLRILTIGNSVFLHVTYFKYDNDAVFNDDTFFGVEYLTLHQGGIQIMRMDTVQILALLMM